MTRKQKDKDNQKQLPDLVSNITDTVSTLDG